MISTKKNWRFTRLFCSKAKEITAFLGARGVPFLVKNAPTKPRSIRKGGCLTCTKNYKNLQAQAQNAIRLAPL